MARAGRKSRYEEDVKSRFKEIKEWCEMGATEKEIATNLGIAQSTFSDYKNKHSEFSALIKKSRQAPVQRIKAALFKRAVGFTYSEIKEVEDAGGIIRRETIKKPALPDPVAALILLKHWDTETEWTNDPALLRVRKKELELKEKSQDDW